MYAYIRVGFKDHVERTGVKGPGGREDGDTRNAYTRLPGVGGGGHRKRVNSMRSEGDQ